MAITRILLAQNENEENQWLKVDHNSRFIINDSNDWQFLFGINSQLSTSSQIIKIGAKFDENTFDNLNLTAYLFDPQNGSIANAATCTFKIFQITTPDWTENLITTVTGTQISNNYFYNTTALSSISPIDLYGGDSVMVEATIIRLGVTYRDRIYVNHLGIYSNVTKLRQDVDYLDVTKVDE